MTTDPMILAKMDAVLRAALEEDMPFGDVSTMAVMPEPRPGRVQLICKQDGVWRGCPSSRGRSSSLTLPLALSAWSRTAPR